MKQRLPLIAIALLLLLGGGIGLLALQDEAPPIELSKSDETPAPTLESKTESKQPSDAALRRERRREHAEKAAAEGKAEADKPKPAVDPNPNPIVTTDKPKAKTPVRDKLAAAVIAKSNTGTTDVVSHTDLPAKVMAEKKDGERVRPHDALRRRAGSGHPRQTRQGSEPGTKKLDPKAAPSEEVQATLTGKLKPGLYTEIYYLGEPAAQILSRNEEPTQGGPALTRIDNYIDFPDRPSFALPYDSDNFIVRWSGFIYIEEDTKIYFGLGNDIAGSLSIDGQAVIVNDVFAWYVETWAAVDITRGYHRITVEHIEGPSGGDTNRNSACRLLYKKTWGASIAPSVVPATWFFQPEAIAAASPVIEKIQPAAASLEDEVQIFGYAFAVDAAGELSNVTDDTLLQDNAVQVFIDGIPAEVVSVSSTKITATIPPGAGSGEVEVRRRGIPSNRMPLTIDEAFGLVLSVWDLSGQPLELPTNRDPDYMILDDNPFPLTRAKFPQFANKPIAIRAEGKVALHTIPSQLVSTKFPDREQPVVELSQPRSGYGLDFKGPSNASAWAKISLASAAIRTIALDSETNSAGSNSVLAGVMEGGMGFTRRVSTQYPWKKNDSDFMLETTNIQPTWTSLSVDLVFPVQGEIDDEAWHEPSFELRASSVHGEPRKSHFRPNFIPPAPPLLEIMSERYVDATGEPIAPAAPVAGELFLLVSKASLDFAGPADQRLRFLIDGQPASFQQGVPKIGGGGFDTEPRYRIVEGAQTPFLPIRVKVPDLVGDGKLRAVMGIVQSPEVSFDVSNRGLVGLYYDFDEVLRVIPDVTNRTPIVRRIDKHLEFENNAIFKLPFPAERFSSEWYGSIRVPEQGEWTFYIQSDDGFRLKIGDQVVSEFPGLRPPQVSSGKIVLGAGWHDLHIEFYENDVLENFVMTWVPPSTGVRERIPLKHLSTERKRGIPDKWPAVAVVEGDD